MRQSHEQTIYDAVTPVAITSSTDATPIVVTATTHGLVTGDRVFISGHATNIAANGIFKITKTSANAFSLQDEFTGADVAGTGAGAGASGRLVKAPPIFLMSDFKHVVLSVITSGTATLTLQALGSIGLVSSKKTSGRGDLPNLGATQGATSPWTYLEIINLDTGAAVDGVTGIAASGTDLNLLYELNVNLVKYFTLVPTAWTQGAFTVKLFATIDQ